MGKYLMIATAFFGIGFVAAPVATASEGLDANKNMLIRTGHEAENALTVVQSNAAAHKATLYTEDERSLLLGDTWMRPMQSSLSPGLILQMGERQSLVVAVRGQDNQLAVSQAGSRNTASVLTHGIQNMTSVAQSGHNHSAATTQSGHSNSIAIIQR